MNTDAQTEPKSRHKRRSRLWWALAGVVVLIGLAVVPPLVNLNRYHSRIVQLISASLRRPARISSAELRLLPRPAFVLTNLVVEEDPAYGAEPVLHATTVVATIRLMPLWRGRIEISRISVDEASVNLVRAPSGQWNLHSLFDTAAATASSGPGGPSVPLPYMEATNSRINIKNGAEKLPFSLLDADASVWQEEGGVWHVRLRAQPARTDISLDLPDTGTVRMEATLGRAQAIRQMALHVDMDWRDAQLGQLSRLVLGSDEGWRGDMTGELHLSGTLERAQIRTRLRAGGVHRVEFAPAAPMDFDANCTLVYRFSDRRLDNLICDSPIGSGRARITGDLAGGDGPLRLAVALDKIPAQVGLDTLRTLRNNLDPSLKADGTVSGKMIYETAPPAAPARVAAAALTSALSGSFIVDGLAVSGDSLQKPIEVSQVVIEPAPAQPGQPASLAASINLPSGAPEPLTIGSQVDRTGFQVSVHGSASLPRLRELAQLAGVPQVDQLDQIAAAPAQVDLEIEGPWLPPAAASTGVGTAILPVLSAYPRSDRMTGTVLLRDGSWKAPFLALPLRFSAARLNVADGALRWDQVDFSYGAVRGSASLELPPPCAPQQTCEPQFTVDIKSLDGGALQAALLGAREPATLLSSLIDRLHPTATPAWPAAEGVVQADAVDLGPFTLSNVSAQVRILPAGAEIASADAATLGGHVHATASFTAGKPDYHVEGTFTQLNPALVGQLFGMRWTGGSLTGDGSMSFSGFTDKDISASATGAVHFDWKGGSAASLGSAAAPAALSRFDRWSGEATIGSGQLTLGENQVQRGSKRTAIQASATFAIPARVTFAPAAAASRAPTQASAQAAVKAGP